MPQASFLSAKHPQLPKSLIGQFSRSPSRSRPRFQAWAPEALLNSHCASKGSLWGGVTPASLSGSIWWLRVSSFSLSELGVWCPLQLSQARQGHGSTSPALEVPAAQSQPSKPCNPARLSSGGKAMPAFQDWVLMPLFSVLPYASSCAAGPGPDAEKAVLSASATTVCPTPTTQEPVPLSPES